MHSCVRACERVCVCLIARIFIFVSQLRYRNGINVMAGPSWIDICEICARTFPVQSNVCEHVYYWNTRNCQECWMQMRFSIVVVAYIHNTERPSYKTNESGLSPKKSTHQHTCAHHQDVESEMKCGNGEAEEKKKWNWNWNCDGVERKISIQSLMWFQFICWKPSRNLYVCAVRLIYECLCWWMHYFSITMLCSFAYAIVLRFHCSFRCYRCCYCGGGSSDGGGGSCCCWRFCRRLFTASLFLYL